MKTKLDPPNVIAKRMSKIIDEELAQNKAFCHCAADDLAEARDLEQRDQEEYKKRLKKRLSNVK